jgi:hypothetical protein
MCAPAFPPPRILLFPTEDFRSAATTRKNNRPSFLSSFDLPDPDTEASWEWSTPSGGTQVFGPDSAV